MSGLIDSADSGGVSYVTSRGASCSTPRC